ncbi:C2 calcium-dependent membrane targeting [Artemisia annua]|uniref:C2 calcium-dependent membrane targeting n=1 Tax=Artemisia annua TaxID=35608 RepID=A0A2U1N7L9_ARTAN|nr:C2 calcium-dependent membrane targeting [Artemisia annua]
MASKQSYSVCFCFRRFHVPQAELPKGIKLLFNQYSANNVMTAEHLQRFLVEVQKNDKATIEEAEAIITHNSPFIFHKKGLNVDAFFKYLISASNHVLSPSSELLEIGMQIDSLCSCFSSILVGQRDKKTWYMMIRLNNQTCSDTTYEKGHPHICGSTMNPQGTYWFMQLQYDIDESYKLYIHPKESPIYVNIKKSTLYGALHWLQIFSQLCHFNLKSRKLRRHDPNVRAFYCENEALPVARDKSESFHVAIIEQAETIKKNLEKKEKELLDLAEKLTAK